MQNVIKEVFFFNYFSLYMSISSALDSSSASPDAELIRYSDSWLLVWPAFDVKAHCAGTLASGVSMALSVNIYRH